MIKHTNKKIKKTGFRKLNNIMPNKFSICAIRKAYNQRVVPKIYKLKKLENNEKNNAEILINAG